MQQTCSRACSRECTAVLAVNYRQWVFCSAYQSNSDGVLSLSCLHILMPSSSCLCLKPASSKLLHECQQAKKTPAFIWSLKLIKWAWNSHFASLHWLGALHNLLNWKQETVRGAGAQNFKRGHGFIFKPLNVAYSLKEFPSTLDCIVPYSTEKRAPCASRGKGGKAQVPQATVTSSCCIISKTILLRRISKNCSFNSHCQRNYRLYY